MPAGSVIGAAFVEIRPDTSGFSRELRPKLVRPATEAGQDAGEAAGKGVERGLRSQQSNLDNAFSRAFAGLGHAALRAAQVGGLAIAGLGAWGIKSAADMQQVEIAFEGILGSAEAAGAFLVKLKAFAATTPFEFPELATATQRLLSLGMTGDQALETMRAIGNAAAAVGAGAPEIQRVVTALAQIQAKGKLSAEELNQIAESLPNFNRGAFFDTLAASIGKTAEATRELAETGGITAEQAIPALLESLRKVPGAMGAMERQSRTLIGVLSTLKDTARDALVEGIAPILPTLTASIEKAVPSIKGALGEIGKIFGTVLTVAIDTLGGILPPIADAFREMAPHIQRFVQALGPLITQLVNALLPAFRELAPAVLGAGTRLATSLVPVVEKLTPVLVTLADVIARIIDVIGPFGVLAVGLGAKLGPMIGNLRLAAGAGEGLFGAVGGLNDALKNAPALIGAFGASFTITTAILEGVFGKAKDLTGALNDLGVMVHGLTKLSDEQLVPAFDKVILKFQEAHPLATKNASVLGAFTEVAEANLGTAVRLAEQYKDNNDVYRFMQTVIARLAQEQQQATSDMNASTDAAKIYADALAKIPPDVNTTVTVTPVLNMSAFNAAVSALPAEIQAGLTTLLPGFAHGGRPEPGEVAVVGERGPELFVPDRPGTIIPNGVSPPSAPYHSEATMGEQHFHLHAPAADPVGFLFETARIMQGASFLYG